MKPTSPFFCTLLPLVIFAVSPSSAVEYVWANLTGTGGLSWDSPANWIHADGTPATSYPKTGDTAVFRGCTAGKVNTAWNASFGDMRMECGYTMLNNNNMTVTSFSCAPFASFSYQHANDNTAGPYLRCTGMTEADNVDGYFPNATGMQNDQHKVFCFLSGDNGRLVWAGKGPSYYANPTNGSDRLYNAGTWPYQLTVPTNAHYDVVCWQQEFGNRVFSDDGALEIGSGMILGGGNNWKWMSIGEPGSAGTNPRGTVRVPEGHALWFGGDKKWILNSRIDAASAVVTRKQTIALVGDHSEDPCDWHVVCGTLQLGGDLPVTSDNCRSDWFNAHPSAVECAGGAGRYVVEWAGTLVVGCANAIPRSATIELPGVYDRPTDATLHGKIRLDADTRCAALLIDGRNAPGGTWGSSQSAARHVDDAIFSGTGVLTVPSPGTFVFVK